MIKAIIFDYDGVIVDSFEGVFEVYKKICKNFRIAPPGDIDEFRKIYGYNYLECLDNLGIKEKDFGKANEIFSEEIVEIDHDIFENIAKVIEKLSAEHDLYLVSASSEKEILPRMKKFGLFDFFQEIYSGADKKMQKSEMFKETMNNFNYSPDEVITIGDRAIDYDASKKAGLDDENIILVTYGWGLNKKVIGDAKIANNPKEILNLIEKINKKTIS